MAIPIVERHDFGTDCLLAKNWIDISFVVTGVKENAIIAIISKENQVTVKF